jgi:hypothetical protein
LKTVLFLKQYSFYMYRVLSILLCLGLISPGFAQKVSVDISACRAMMDVVDALKGGKTKEEVSRQLDSILTTEPFVVMFRHYNRPFRPDHLPPGVFKRMILSLRYPEAYTAGEKERADQMLVYWKRFYERPEYYRKSIVQLQGTNLQQLISGGVRYAQSWLPPGMDIPSFILLHHPQRRQRGVCHRQRAGPRLFSTVPRFGHRASATKRDGR